MHRTRIKICGITRPQDAEAAAVAGADAIGIVLHAGIKRSVSIEDAKKIIAALPPFVGVVGLFVDDEVGFMRDAAAELHLTAVQLHGHESVQVMQSLSPVGIIKAVHVAAETLREQLNRLRAARMAGLLLDAAGGGGKGVSTDWTVVEDHIRNGDFAGLPPWIAAGGLNPTNVGDVVKRLRPWAVDVSSGVEAGPREKSPDAIAAFVAAVRQADAED